MSAKLLHTKELSMQNTHRIRSGSETGRIIAEELRERRDSSKDSEGRRSRKRDKDNVKTPSAQSADALSDQSTPKMSGRSTASNCTARATTAAESQRQKDEALPRRTMINGVLTLDCRFDRTGQSIKDGSGRFIKPSPFNSIRTLRRSTPEKAEMLEVIRLCAGLQGGSDRLPPIPPEYFSQPLSPTGRFEAPLRIPDKRAPLGI